MAELFYREDRDEDFFNACQQVRKEEKNLSVSQTVSRAIRRPAKSFWLHPREYSAIIRKNGARLPKNEVKRELHPEILKRYEQLKKEHPGMDVAGISKIIAEQSAPRFYISQKRGEAIYFQMLKKPQPLLQP